MVWQIVNDVNTEFSQKVPLFARSPFIEFEGLLGDQREIFEQVLPPMAQKMMLESIELAENMPSPRVIKTHLPLEMLPPDLLDTCKVIFVCRNPKDVCVSFFHHQRNISGYNYLGDFKQFAEMFKEGTTHYGSYWTMLKVCTTKNFPKLNFLLSEKLLFL